MVRIDRFVPLLNQPGAERITIVAGEHATLVVGGKSRKITTDPMTPQQVEALVSEIVPTNAVIDGPTGCEFNHAAPVGVVRVRVSGDAMARQIQIFPKTMAVATPEPRAPSEPPAGRSGGPRGIEDLLRRMVAEKCSDLHIVTGGPPYFRKDGEIVRLPDWEPLRPEQAMDLLYGITPPQFREAFEEDHDVDFSHEIPGVARFRCNLFLDRQGAGGVFRAIPAKIPTVEELGLSRHILELCDLSKGLVLVTGPTGSGKSTTLAAMIDYINGHKRGHLITIEDPIEFVHQSRKCLVNQREVGSHTKGFKNALRAALREDPDIVLVGEMRDLETMAIAIETAETGHLVFGTLHTNTAASTVDRIVDQFPPDRQAQVRTMLSEALKGVVSQTLCRKKGGGRVAAYEVLIVNSAISNLIREGKTFQIPSIMQTGKSAGMVCMNDALQELVQKGLVAADEALAKSAAKAELKSLLARSGLQAASA